MNPTNIEFLTQLFTVIGTLGTFILAIIKTNIIGKTIRFVKQIADTHEKIDRIFHEITPNGGGSIKDVVNNINERIIKTEERQKAFLNDSSNAIFETDCHGNLKYVNKAFTALFGRSLEESNGMKWLVNIHGDDRDKFLKEWETCVKLKNNFSMMHRCVDYYGEEFRVQTKAEVMQKNNKEVLGWLGFIQKIT